MSKRRASTDAAPRRPSAAELSPEQLRAVTHAGGPLIVLAGPGTGKTRVITHRVAHLLCERGLRPESVLAVTYTTKAAQELRGRLAELVSPSAADRVNASTFHSFGLRLLRRFGDALDLPPVRAGTGGPQLTDSAQRRRLYREVIAEHGLFPFARAAGVDAAIGHLARTVSALADAAIDPDDAQAFIARWSAALDAGTDAQGNPLEDARSLAAQREHLRRFSETVRAWTYAEAAARARGWLNFGDLIALPVRLLSTNAGVASIVRDELRAVVVDEFQDVNAAMIRLLRAICPPALNPDLAVVGDDDQAIFRFRGADDRAFARFAALYPTCARVALTDNHRSTPHVIDTAASVISRAAFRFDPDKRTVFPPGKPAPTGAAPVELLSVPGETLDAPVVAALIAHELARPSPPSASSFAVVARSHTDLRRVADALRLEAVPFRLQKEGSLLDDEGVQDLLAWSRVLVRPEETWNLRRVLTRPPIAVHLDDLRAFESAYRAALSAHRAGRPGADDPGPMPAWLVAHAPDHPCVARFAAIAAELAPIATSVPAGDALSAIVRHAQLAHSELLPAPEHTRRVAAVLGLIAFAREHAARLQAPGDLAALLAHIDDLDHNDLARKSPQLEADDDQDPDQPADAVTLITAHSAKGLEFDTVFVPRVSPGKAGYPSTSAGDGEGPILPPGLVDDAGDERSEKERQLDEERRLFYVACTRARRRLILLTRRTKSPSKSVHFAQELAADPALAGRALVEIPAEDALRRCGRDPQTVLGAEPDTPAGQAAAWRERLDAARTHARQAAAGALNAIDAPRLDPASIETAQAWLAKAARTLAALAHARASGSPPGWHTPGVDPDLDRLLAAPDQPAPAPTGLRFRPPRPPLRISYSLIKAYESCPRCYALQYLYDLPQPPGPWQALGSAAHAALQAFAQAQRDSEDGRRAPPTLDELLTLGSDAYFASLPPHREPDKLHREQLLAQLTLAHERLLKPTDHILELEFAITAPYRRAGQPAGEPDHVLVARLDRLDQITLPDGQTGFRVVDYKSGVPTKSQREPARSDLQLGIYALALDQQFGEGRPVRGVAEYWLLATGEVGRIDLDAIDRTKVRAAIDKALAGILAGDFHRSSSDRTDHVCDLLGPE
jgi:DNA helicase II / ATP-dependent DNA helicase PcrA